jgi:hypothetical protein
LGTPITLLESFGGLLGCTPGNDGERMCRRVSLYVAPSSRDVDSSVAVHAPMAGLTPVANAASAASVARPRTRGRLYSCDARLERLTQDIEDMAAALGPFIQEEHAVVGQ